MGFFFKLHLTIIFSSKLQKMDKHALSRIKSQWQLGWLCKRRIAFVIQQHPAFSKRWISGIEVLRTRTSVNDRNLEYLSPDVSK